MGAEEESDFKRMAAEFRAAADAGDEEPKPSDDNALVLGARVEAKVEGWNEYYKGVIVGVKDDGTFAIDFDDGESLTAVEAGQMRPVACMCNVKPGQRARVSLAVWGDQAFDGTVKAITGPGACEIHFDDGEKIKFVPLDFVEPLQQEVPTGETSAPSSKFARGDKISAQLDGWDQAYEGIVDNVSGTGTYKVLFDDGEVADQVAEHLLKVVKTHQTFAPEDRVEAKLAGWDKYYGGKIVAAVGRSGYECLFDDGEHVPLAPSNLLRKARPKLWPAGTRVLAKIPAWKTAYPGTVQSANLNGTYQILFDDGDCQDAVLHEDVEKLRSEEAPRDSAETDNEATKSGGRDSQTATSLASSPSGKFAVDQRVEAKIPDWAQYYQGTVMGANSDGTYCVNFDDGEMIPALEARYMRVAQKDDSKWSKGMRVEVQIPDWDQHYPGIIEKAHDNGTFHVIFDDGDVVEHVKSEQMRSAAAKPVKEPAKSAWAKGMRVEVQIPEWDQHYPGVIEKAHDDGTFHVIFDDGEVVEHVKSAQMRALSTDSDKKPEKNAEPAKVPGSVWSKGMRVEVQIPEWDQHYPGTIEKTHDDGTFHVIFDDGDVVEHAKPDQMRALSSKSDNKAEKKAEPAKVPGSVWSKGMRVEVQIPEWDQHYPGTIEKTHGDGTFHVIFDDGDVVEHAKPDQMRAMAMEQAPAPSLNDIQLGDRVSAKLDTWKKAYKGVVTAVHDDGSLKIDFDDGEIAHKVPQSTVVEVHTDMGHRYVVGDRIIGHMPAWAQPYHGQVEKTAGRGSCTVRFEDGEVLPFFPNELMHPDPAALAAAAETQDKPSSKQDIKNVVAAEQQPIPETEVSADSKCAPPSSTPEGGPGGQAAAAEASGPAAEPTNAASPEFEEGPELATGDEALAPSNETDEPIVERAPPGPKKTQTVIDDEVDENRVQVFLCMLRGMISRKSRGKDGNVDPERAMRAFFRNTKRRNARIDLEAFKRGVETLRIEAGPDSVLRAVLSRVSSTFAQEGSVSVEALRDFLVAQVPADDSLEGQIRALVRCGPDLARAFRKFDLDGSGKVSAAELCRVFDEASDGASMSLEAAHLIIGQFDANGDGELDEAEFMRFAMPDFGIVAVTPLGEFFAPVDPSATIGSLRTQLGQRALHVLGPRARDHYGGRSVRLARGGGSRVLEPPHVKSAMLCAEVLVHGEQIWLLPFSESSGTREGARGSTLGRRGSSAHPVDAKDREVSIARQRLEQVFAFLDAGPSQTCTPKDLVQAVRSKPQIRKLLSGSALLAPLRDKPTKVLASIGKDAVSCAMLTRALIPQKLLKKSDAASGTLSRQSSSTSTAGAASRTKSGASTRSNNKKKNPWKDLKQQAAAAREFVNRYKDTGAHELAVHYEETLGKDTMASLSQDARARLWEPRGAAFDMRIDPKVRVNEAGEQLYGQSPTETQQWVNALSSDKWLGIDGGGAAQRRGKRKDLAMCEAYASAADLPADPSTWTAHEVRQWVVRKLELPALAPAFETVTGKELLSIFEDDELPRTISESLPLQQRKVLAHIEQLRENYRILRARRNPRALAQDPRQWCVADVIEWLAQSLGAPREVQRAFRARSIDGCLLASLEEEELREEVGIDAEWAAKVRRAARVLAAHFEGATLSSPAQGVPPQRGRAHGRENAAEDVDRFVLDDIESAMAQQVIHREPVVPRGSGRHAVQALREERQFPELREEARGRLEDLVERMSPKKSKDAKAFRSSESVRPALSASLSGPACLKSVEAALFAEGRRGAEAAVEAWFRDADAISLRDFGAALAQLFGVASLPRGPIDRLWRDVLELELDEELPVHVARRVFVLGQKPHNAKDAKETANIVKGASTSYIRVLNDATGRLRVLDYKGGAHNAAAVNALIAKVAEHRRAYQKASDAARRDVDAERTIAALEQDFDRALLGELG